MGIYAIKPVFRRLLSPLQRRLVASGVSADALTLAGLGFAGAAGAGVWLGRGGGGWLLLVPLGAVLRIVANALDGMVATSTGTARPLGEVLNEVSDRIGDVAVFLPMSLVPGVDAVLVAGALAAMLVTSYLGLAVKAAGGPRLYDGVMGKPDRMFVVGVAAVVATVTGEPATAWTWALWIVLVGALVTLLTRWRTARESLR